jgi:hypothetical protein
MDVLIARIKARAADPLRALDAATWVVPMPRVRPPARPAEVDAAEAALGFSIPTLLRRLYIEVGNGGFGPYYGLEGVPTVPPTPWEADIVSLYEQYSGSDDEHPIWRWPHGLVPLIGNGCLSIECVDFLRPPHAVVGFDGNDCDWDRPLTESLRPIAASLVDRLESWLARDDNRAQPAL